MDLHTIGTRVRQSDQGFRCIQYHRERKGTVVGVVFTGRNSKVVDDSRVSVLWDGLKKAMPCPLHFIEIAQPTEINETT